MELEAAIPAGLRVDVKRCFPMRAGPKAAQGNRRRLERLQLAAATLQRRLAPDEPVAYITFGHESFWWESLALGYLAAFINHRTIVVTHRRILLIATDRGGHPGCSVNEVPFSAIRKVEDRFGRFTLLLADGKVVLDVEMFTAKAFLPAVAPARDSATGGQMFLCPSCPARHPRYTERCGSCSVQFKSPREAIKRSLFMPGLGAFYGGDSASAVLMGLRGSATALATLAIWTRVLDMGTFGGPRDALFFLLLFVVFHVGDAFVAGQQIQKGLLPIRQT